MTTAEKQYYRQGDVVLLRTDNTDIPEGFTEEKPGENGIVLKFGSATGHMHRIVKGAQLLKAASGNDLLVVGEHGADLIHEEHATIPLPSGNYEVLQQREYTPEEIRAVMD